MKRLASHLSFIFAALAATPAALAGSEVLKCVDAAGHVTLTDKPCENGAHGTRLGDNPEPYAMAAQPQPVAVQRSEAAPAMLGQQDWRPRLPQRARPLAHDVATLKAARAQLMLTDAVRQPRPQLATIQ